MKRIMAVLVVIMTVLAFTYVTPLADARHHSGHSGTHSGYHHGDRHGHYAGTGHYGRDRHRDYYSSRYWSSYHPGRSKHDRGYRRDGHWARQGYWWTGYYSGRSMPHYRDGGTRHWDRHKGWYTGNYHRWWIGYSPRAYERGYYWPHRSYDRYSWWNDYYPYRGSYERGYYWPHRSYDRYNWWSPPYPVTGTRVGSGPGTYDGGYYGPPEVVPEEPGERLSPFPAAGLDDYYEEELEPSEPGPGGLQVGAAPAAKCGPRGNEYALYLSPGHNSKVDWGGYHVTVTSFSKNHAPCHSQKDVAANDWKNVHGSQPFSLAKKKQGVDYKACNLGGKGGKSNWGICFNSKELDKVTGVLNKDQFANDKQNKSVTNNNPKRWHISLYAKDEKDAYKKFKDLGLKDASWNLYEVKKTGPDKKGKETADYTPIKAK